jgi:hypothetical protein
LAEREETEKAVDLSGWVVVGLLAAVPGELILAGGPGGLLCPVRLRAVSRAQPY